MKKQGLELKIRGVVQGVGFRPFVFRLASELGFSGSVANCGDGVIIRLAPPLFHLDRFLKGLQDGPPLSHITALEKRSINIFSDNRTFEILASSQDGPTSTLIPPDISLCDDCRQELFDPADRRFLYPFINCTNCGPRFSIIESIPYDRPKTSMKVFPMCPSCEQEYHDAADRRFHAQANGCPVCGPHLSWHDRQGRKIECDDPVAMATHALQQGKIVAIRGLGGFHLAVNATSEEAVLKLRQRKKRQDKPLAVIVPDSHAAGKICILSKREKEALLSHQRPIVLLEKRKNDLAGSLAPGVNQLGVMLPYTPLHHVLFRHPGAPQALVMTSGNKSDEPICTTNEDAVQKLSAIADNFLLHNRHIVTRLDDSVVRVINNKMRIMRRARGYVPGPVSLSPALPTLLACGAELKNTFCLTRGKEAFLSQHIGDLKRNENLIFFEESVGHLQDILEIKPTAAARDFHPDYLSSRFAAETGLPVQRVQHHHAHAVAVMAEHGLEQEVLAVILDGSGYGTDGTLWGGEFLLAGLSSFKRLGHFSRLMLPGGDRAAQQPWRMGLSALYHACGADKFQNVLPASLSRIPAEKRRIVVEMMEAGFNSPITSSCGRLFDAIAALLGLCLESDYEGQAAMELEALALQAAQDGLCAWEPALSFPVQIDQEQDHLVLQSSPMITGLVAALSAGSDPALLALAFHQWLIAAIRDMIGRLAGEPGKKKVVLGGGCMQNALLLQGLENGLAQDGFEVFSGEMVPVNDGGVSLGQAVIGGLQMLK